MRCWCWPLLPRISWRISALLSFKLQYLRGTTLHIPVACKELRSNADEQESAQGADALLVLASLAQDQLEDPPAAGRGMPLGSQAPQPAHQPASAPGACHGCLGFSQSRGQNGSTVGSRDWMVSHVILRLGLKPSRSWVLSLQAAPGSSALLDDKQVSGASRQQVFPLDGATCHCRS